MNKKQIDGFTLIEMSITVVIIGLLIGAVLTGKNILHNAKISSLMTNAQNYRSSIATFRQQYHYLPGDMANAADFFAGATNGNGDGSLANSGSTVYESLNAWHQLSSANIIDDTFPDSTASGNTLNGSIPGEDVPESDFNSVGYWLYFHAQDASTGRTAGNFLKIGTRNSSNGTNLREALSPQDAAIIDEKIDDGKAKTGFVIGETGYGSSSCLTSNEYNGTEDQRACQLWFLLD